jgi:hypothetical protein
MQMHSPSLPGLSDRLALPCAECGYDLRAQPREGVCPECETPVEKAIELAAVPVRPAWHDSDPRWHRRMLAGAWVLVLVPLVAALQAFGLASRVPVPVPYDFQGAVQTLEESFVTWVYPYLVFCIGVVLFFSKERYRRRHRLDWTRRWGVMMSYGVLLLGVPGYAFFVSLVLIGITALFQSLPFANQPAVTELLGQLGSGYIYYGPHGSETVNVTLAVFSACAVLLACVPIYNALRSSGPKALALVMLAPLALIAMWYIGAAAIWALPLPLDRSPPPPMFFFEPHLLLAGLTDLESGIRGRIWFLLSLAREAAKWLVFLGVAIWLSVAQARAWRKSPTREILDGRR